MTTKPYFSLNLGARVPAEIYENSDTMPKFNSVVFRKPITTIAVATLVFAAPFSLGFPIFGKYAIDVIAYLLILAIMAGAYDLVSNSVIRTTSRFAKKTPQAYSLAIKAFTLLCAACLGVAATNALEIVAEMLR